MEREARRDMGVVCTTTTWRARPELAGEVVGKLRIGQVKRIKTVM